MDTAPSPLLTLATAPDGALLASSPDGLSRSIDGGGMWHTVVPGEAGSVTRITFGAADQGWAVRTAGDALLRSRDGGRSWHELGSPFGVLSVAALQALPDSLVAATWDSRRTISQVWRSPDDGLTWERGLEAQTSWPVVCSLPDPPLLTLGGSALVQVPDGAWRRTTVTEWGGLVRLTGDADILVCLSTVGLHWSHDRGLTWSQDESGLPVEQVLDIMIDRRALHVLLTGGRIWRRPMA